jgi:hypothetical protein
MGLKSRINQVELLTRKTALELIITDPDTEGNKTLSDSLLPVLSELRLCIRGKRKPKTAREKDLLSLCQALEEEVTLKNRVSLS